LIQLVIRRSDFDVLGIFHEVRHVRAGTDTARETGGGVADEGEEVDVRGAVDDQEAVLACTEERVRGFFRGATMDLTPCMSKTKGFSQFSKRSFSCTWNKST